MSKKGGNTIEAKRDEFSSYLESNGVVDNLTEVLINLYEEGERPKFPTDYIRTHLKSTEEGESEVIALNKKLRDENKKLKERVAELEKVLEGLMKDAEG